jgi:histidine triad (HIT) family protein
MMSLFTGNAFKKTATAFASSQTGRYFISWMLTNMSFAIPVEKLLETSILVAIYHPKPDFPVHILLIPKKQKATLFDLRTDDQDFMIELFASVRNIVRQLNLEQQGYRLIVNGGSYQEFPYLHFHLVSGGK